MYFPSRNCIKISKNKCCKCYNYKHACLCYKKTHPYGKNKHKEDSCFCHDYPGHFSSVCFANPCDPNNNCCKKQPFCKSFKDNHDYNCCSPHHGNPHHGNPHHGNPHHGNPHHGNPHHGNPHHGNPHHGNPHHGNPLHGKCQEGHYYEHHEESGKCCDREEKAMYDVPSKLGHGLIAYNTYTYYHPPQDKNDCKIINNKKHYYHRCKMKCKCIVECCNHCKSYFYDDPHNKRPCPNCKKKNPNNCKKCNIKYHPIKRWNYNCPMCEYNKKQAYVSTPNYQYWEYN